MDFLAKLAWLKTLDPTTAIAEFQKLLAEAQAAVPLISAGVTGVETAVKTAIDALIGVFNPTPTA